MVPSLITFDVFGTVLDWKSGMEASCLAAGRPLRHDEFDSVINRQAELEAEVFCSYSEITRRSLIEVLGLDEHVAEEIGNNVGEWPLFSDASALRGLMKITPCAAMTNSDRAHGKQVQQSLGFELSDWLSAEEIRLYKPDPNFWWAMSRRTGVQPGPTWWHASAYADYDLAVADQLGPTTVFVRRAHARPGSARHEILDLSDLVAMLD